MFIVGPVMGKTEYGDDIRNRRAVGMKAARYSGWRPPAEAREEAATIGVALAQPHRRALTDPRAPGAEDVLWQFCRRQRLREELYRAGVAYGQLSRRAKAAMGIRVPGWEIEPSEEYDEAERQKRAREAIQEYGIATTILRRKSLQTYFALEELCFYARELGETYWPFVPRGLSAMALHFGILPLDVYS